MTETISCKLKQILDKLDIDIFRRLTDICLLIASLSCLYYAATRLESIVYLINAFTGQTLPEQIRQAIIGIALLLIGYVFYSPLADKYMYPYFRHFSRTLLSFGGWTHAEIQLLRRIDDLFDSMNFLEDNYRFASGNDPSVTIEDIHSLRQQLAEFEAEYLKIGGPEHA
jgi:hypothetical protein